MNDTMPFWKKIIYNGIETEYYVSIYGDVYCPRLKKMLSQFTGSKGKYKSVHLFINGEDVKCLVHRLVAIAFIPNPENKPQVNHINANTFNNYYKNLEWNTPYENIHHMINLGHQVIGSEHPNSKYTDDQIRNVCKLLENDNAILEEISKNTGVSIKTIGNIKHGVGWKHISKDYNIKFETLINGPKFSNVSLYIKELISDGKTNAEIYDAVNKSGLAESISKKSIYDRVYHIRILLNNSLKSKNQD